jgi:hypothetical protein
MTEREIEKPIEVARGNRYGHRDATAILLAYRHGLRASEFVALAITTMVLTEGLFPGQFVDDDRLGLMCGPDGSGSSVASQRPQTPTTPRIKPTLKKWSNQFMTQPVPTCRNSSMRRLSV